MSKISPNSACPPIDRLFGRGTVTGLTDAELLERFVTDRDEASFELLMSRHGPMVLRACRGVLGDRHEAEDAFQATFLVLARRAGSLWVDGSLGSWLYRIAVRIALQASENALRRRRSERHAADRRKGDDRQGPPLEPDVIPIVCQEVERLPEKYRAPVVLCHLEELSHEAAARVLGWPVGTVHGRLSRARAMLRRRLSRRGVTLAVGTLAAAFGAGDRPAAAAALRDATLRAALNLAAGQGVAASVGSASVAALLAGALRAMMLRTLRTSAVVALTIGVLAGASLLAASSPGRMLAATPAGTPPREQAVRPSAAPDAAEGEPDPLPPRGLVRLGTDRLRTQNHVSGFAFSPDGRLAAVADANAPAPRVAIFDVDSGRQVDQLAMPVAEFDWVECVAFSPDGSRLIWGESDGRVALWDLKARRPIFRGKLHGDAVTDVGFSPDGRLMVSAAGDAIHLRRASDPEETVRDLPARPEPLPGAPRQVRTILGPVRGPVSIRVAFTPDGRRLIAGNWATAMASVWNLEDGRLLRQIGPVADQGLNSLAVTPDGRRLLTAGSRSVPRAGTTVVMNSPTVSLDEVRLWDIATGERVRDLTGAEDYGFGIAALSTDGRRVAVADLDRLRIRDTATGAMERSIALPGSWGARTAFSPDGTLVATPEQNALAIFEVATGRRRHHDEATPVGLMTAATWSPSGDRIVTAHNDGDLRAWDAATGRLIWRRPLAPSPGIGGGRGFATFVQFSRDGRLVVAAGRRDDPDRKHDGVVAICDAATGRSSRDVAGIEMPWEGRLLEDGRMAIFATSTRGSGSAHLLGVELGTGRVRWTSIPEGQRDGSSGVAAMQVLPNSTSVAAALRDGNILIVNALTGHERRRFLADARSPEQRKAGRPDSARLGWGAFSGDGRTLVACAGEWLDVWDVETGSLRRRIRQPNPAGCRLALAPDGRTLATSDVRFNDDLGRDTIRLIDIAAGEPVLTLEPRDDRASVLAFSPDGNRLLTGFGRGSVLVWDVRRRQAAPKAKRRAGEAAERALLPYPGGVRPWLRPIVRVRGPGRPPRIASY